MLTCRPVSTFSSFAEMDRLIGAFAAAPTVRPAAFYPPVNVWEDEHALHVESELPGFTLENLDISTLGSELTIAGTRPTSATENTVYLRRERSSAAARFKRTLKIGIPFDADNVRAGLKNGVLTITLPKAPVARPRKISVTP